MAKANTQAANKTRAQKAKALHEQKTKERASDQATLKAMYLANPDDPILVDVLAKCQEFISYHVRIAQDGVGARKTGFKLADGTAEIENYFFTNDEVASEMKKAAGIQELLDYLNRQLTIPVAPKVKKIVS